jgi:hypothetical protein
MGKISYGYFQVTVKKLDPLMRRQRFPINDFNTLCNAFDRRLIVNAKFIDPAYIAAAG